MEVTSPRSTCRLKLINATSQETCSDKWLDFPRPGDALLWLSQRFKDHLWMSAGQSPLDGEEKAVRKLSYELCLVEEQSKLGSLRNLQVMDVISNQAGGWLFSASLHEVLEVGHLIGWLLNFMPALSNPACVSRQKIRCWITLVMSLTQDNRGSVRDVSEERAWKPVGINYKITCVHVIKVVT